MLQVRADCPSRDEEDSVPPRPSSGNRPTGVPIAAPTDIRAGRRIDEFGGVIRHRKLEGRDVAGIARVAVRVRGDYGLDVDQRKIRIAQQQSSRPWHRWRTRAGTEQHYWQYSGSHGVALSVECGEANNLCAGSASSRLPVTLYNGCRTPIKYRPRPLRCQSNRDRSIASPILL
jgi:hypothetical protein